MARGSQAKEEITKKLLETFEGSFLYNGGKEIRIPMMEEDSLLQIKVALTCAKENVCGGPDLNSQTQSENNEAAPALQEPTEQEINNVKSLMEALDL